MQRSRCSSDATCEVPECDHPPYRNTKIVTHGDNSTTDGNIATARESTRTKLCNAHY